MPTPSPSSRKANAAIFFVASEFDTARQDLKGRHAATESFFKGLVDHAELDRFYCCAASEQQAKIFQERAREWGRDTPVTWLPTNAPHRYGEAGCLYLPHPVLSAEAWQRRAVNDRAYSLCGVTHTTASHNVMQGFADLLTAPFRSWDAIICTSNSVLNTAKVILQDQAEYLRARLGAQRFELPQLPVIPLGIHTADFAHSEQARMQWRQKLGIAPDDIMILFVGRLSFHAKAHPLAMYLALEAAQKKTKRRLHLVQAGWFANEHIERAFRDGARDFCPSVQCHFVDGRQKETRSGIWSAADIFTSLSDNLQETFGLTPIEAMAAGLPVVVSDWDGYRDTVRNGVDGLLIPTLMPQAPFGRDWAFAYDVGTIDYDMYCGRTSQVVSVDIDAAAEAYLRLADNDTLRKHMGEAGNQRANEFYDWKAIIPKYQELWFHLAERRRAASAESEPKQYRPANPARPDPFHIFADYANHKLKPSTVFALREDEGVTLLERYRQASLVRFVEKFMPSQEECTLILQHLKQHGPTRADQLALLVPERHRLPMFRGLCWLAKLGLIKRNPAPPSIDDVQESTESLIAG